MATPRSSAPVKMRLPHEHGDMAPVDFYRRVPSYATAPVALSRTARDVKSRGQCGDDVATSERPKPLPTVETRPPATQNDRRQAQSTTKGNGRIPPLSTAKIEAYDAPTDRNGRNQHRTRTDNEGGGEITRKRRPSSAWRKKTNYALPRTPLPESLSSIDWAPTTRGYAYHLSFR